MISTPSYNINDLNFCGEELPSSDRCDSPSLSPLTSDIDDEKDCIFANRLTPLPSGKVEKLWKNICSMHVVVM